MKKNDQDDEHSTCAEYSEHKQSSGAMQGTDAFGMSPETETDIPAAHRWPIPAAAHRPSKRPARRMVPSRGTTSCTCKPEGNSSSLQAILGSSTAHASVR